MRAIPLVVMTLVLGAAAVVRLKCERRDQVAQRWAAATDAPRGDAVRSVP